MPCEDGVMRLTLSQKLCGVHKGEPDERLPIGTIYYTTFLSICKVSIMTKNWQNFRENAYSIEFMAKIIVLFCT